MKLTKKHVGGLYDVQGGDGSWVYQLMAVRQEKLLFYVVGSCPTRYEIDTNKYADWRPFNPAPLSRAEVKRAWGLAKETR